MLSLILCLLALTATSSADFGRESKKFAKELYGKIVEKKPDQDVIFSPFSIHTALALLSAGATGETASELYAHLGSNNREEIAAVFHDQLQKYENSSLLQIANKIYAGSGATINPDFKDLATRKFFSGVDNVNFANNVDAAKTISDWVDERTHGKIKDLIPSSVLNSMTRMVIVNAIYFKGKWQYPFSPQATELESFYTSEEDSVDVPMMNREARFAYGVFEELDATAVELPYEESDLSMIVILPNKRTGISDLEARLQTADVNTLYSQMSKAKKVYVTLPKFKSEFSIELKEVLQGVGIKKIFGPAELGNLLVSDLPLYVSNVVHKAFIEVSEEGTVAAAATGVAIQGRSGRVDWPIYFTADHPFFYVIRDSQGFVYFAGKFVKSS